MFGLALHIVLIIAGIILFCLAAFIILVFLNSRSVVFTIETVTKLLDKIISFVGDFFLNVAWFILDNKTYKGYYTSGVKNENKKV